MTNAIAVQDREHWHDLRGQNIGASEVAALFDESPYLTAFELWHQKAGNLPRVDLDDNERVQAGNHMEPAIAAWTAEKTGWRIQKVRRYLTHPIIQGMGASLDYEIIGHPRGPGVLEIKNVDGLVYREWEGGEPPIHMLLQVQHQMAVSGRRWGAVAACIGGNRLEIFQYERREPTVALIEQKVADFWDSVRSGRAPTPDFSKDAEAIIAMHQAVSGDRVVDLAGNNHATVLMAEYRMAGDAEKVAAERKKAAKAELLTIMGDASAAICGDYKISAKMIGPSMVEAYERKPYRDFRINQIKAKEAKSK